MFAETTHVVTEPRSFAWVVKTLMYARFHENLFRGFRAPEG